MWSGPLHDREFVEEALKLVKGNPSAFGTSTRMQGMLTVASEVSIVMHSSVLSADLKT